MSVAYVKVRGLTCGKNTRNPVMGRVQQSDRRAAWLAMQSLWRPRISRPTPTRDPPLLAIPSACLAVRAELLQVAIYLLVNRRKSALVTKIRPLPPDMPPKKQAVGAKKQPAVSQTQNQNQSQGTRKNGSARASGNGPPSAAELGKAKSGTGVNAPQSTGSEQTQPSVQEIIGGKSWTGKLPQVSSFRPIVTRMRY